MVRNKGKIKKWISFIEENGVNDICEYNNESGVTYCYVCGLMFSFVYIYKGK